MVAWSTATIGGASIAKSLPVNAINHSELADECKHMSQSIIRGKGATPFGIGSTVSSICSSVLFDRRDVRPISHFQPEFRCCFSLPVILGRKGIITTIQIPLNNSEQARITESAETLTATIDRIKSE